MVSDRQYGRCGENLECRVRHDLDMAQGLEAICYCRYEETVCGTDNVTYDSECQLNAAVSVKNMPIGVSRKGPCNSGRTNRPCFCILAVVKPGFHSNASACVGKQPIMVATASTEHSYWLALAFVASRKRLRFLRFSFTQRTQRKRLRLNGNRASVLLL